MSTRYIHTNIVSHNWKRIARFYLEVFECVPVPPERNLAGRWLEQGTGVENAALCGMHLRLPGFGANGPTLEIFQYGEVKENHPPAANRKGFSHIAFHVDDVKEIYEKVLAHGGSALGEMTVKEIEGVGTLTFVYMTDPDGNIVEIQNRS